jgi:hypothetical protein
MSSELGLYDFLLQDHILGQYMREPNSSKVSRTRETLRQEQGVRKSEQTGDGTDSSSEDILMSDDDNGSKDSEEENGTPIPYMEEEPEPVEEPVQIIQSPTNLHFICADRIFGLVEKWYIRDHRNSAMLCITGAIRRSWSDIAYEDAEKIIEEFCKTAGDEEVTARLAMLRSTYEKEDPGEIAGFGPFADILSKLEPDMATDKQTQTINDVRHGIYAALDDFKANSILERYPDLEIHKSKNRHIVAFEHTVEEVEFPQAKNSILKETIRSVQRKALLLNAAPIAPIKEVWDPIYNQTKYKISFRSIGKAAKPIIKEPDKLMTIDELEEWLRVNASYYHKPGRLDEVLHAIVDAYTKADLIDHSIGTEIEGLVFLSDHKGRSKLVLSNMDRPSMPSREQAQACIKLTQHIRTQFYSSDLETDRFADFLKVGVVAPVDFARRQSGAVNQYDIIPRRDLGGWTESEGADRIMTEAAEALPAAKASIVELRKVNKTYYRGKERLDVLRDLQIEALQHLDHFFATRIGLGDLTQAYDGRCAVGRGLDATGGGCVG